MCSRHQGRGFTLIELLVVLLIIMLLMSVGVPVFSQFFKSSRIQQASEAVYTSLFNARSNAQRARGFASVYFGDDVQRLAVQPKVGVLPAYGSIETWSVKGQPGDLLIDNFEPWAPGYSSGWPPGYWYPFNVKLTLLTPNSVSFPNGIRVIAGKYSRFWDSTSIDFVSRFAFPYYKRDSVGELKRHSVTFTRTGRTAGFGEKYNYTFVLVFDAATGEHRVIDSGSWYSNARPRILPYGLTHIGTDKLKANREIDGLINAFPGNS